MPNYGQLQSDVADWVIDLPAEVEAQIPAFINKAVRDAERDHDFKHMEATTAAFTTVADTRKLGDKPDDWKESRGNPWYLRDDGTTREIDWAASQGDTLRQFDEGDTDDDGAPQFVLENADTFDVYPYSDGSSDYSDGQYRIKVPYWAYSAALSANDDTNWWTDNAQWYITFQAAGEAALMNRDRQTAGEMFQRAVSQFSQLKNQDKRSKLRRRAAVEPRSGVYGPGRMGRRLGGRR